MNRFLTSALLVLGGVSLLGASASGSACSCIPPGTPAEEFASSDVVLAAEVGSMRHVDGSHGPDLEVRLHVVRAFKGLGDRVTSLTVRTASDGAACGYPFERGHAYMVYAHEFDGRIWVSLCSRTRPLGAASDDLRQLDAEDLIGYEPSDDGGCGGTTNLGMIQAASFTLIGIGVLRRRRRSP